MFSNYATHVGAYRKLVCRFRLFDFRHTPYKFLFAVTYIGSAARRETRPEYIDRVRASLFICFFAVRNWPNILVSRALALVTEQQQSTVRAHSTAMLKYYHNIVISEQTDWNNIVHANTRSQNLHLRLVDEKSG